MILLTAGFAGFAVFLCILLGGIVALLSLNKPKDLHEALAVVLAGGAGVFLVIALNRWSKRVRIPESFQTWLPAGVHFRKLKKVREKGGKQIETA